MRTLMASAAFVLLTSGVFAGNSNDRVYGLSADLGVGWCPWISYPTGIQNTFDQLAALPGVTKSMVALNLDLAVPVFQKTGESAEASTVYFISGGIDAFATRVEDYSGSLQMNNYVMGVGLQSKTGHLVSRVHVGPAFAVAQLSTSSGEDTARSDNGIGVYSRISYTTSGGPGLGLTFGVMAEYTIIEHEASTAFGLIGSLSFY